MTTTTTNTDFDESLRHDEQQDERCLDDREYADNDVQKGKVLFPTEKLFGRQKEIQVLSEIVAKLSSDSDSDTDTDTDSQDKKCPSSLSPSLCSYSPSPSPPSSQLLFVEGFSGVGKSSLIKQGLIGLMKKQRKQYFFAVGKYDEHVGVEPLSAINEALTGLIHDLRKHARDALKRARKEIHTCSSMSGGDADKLVSILPSLLPLLSASKSKSETRVDLSLPQVDIKAASFLFVHCIDALCKALGCPLILVFDDIQWADVSSIELLQPLLRRMPTNNLLIVCSFRSNEVGKDHFVRKQIDDLTPLLEDRMTCMEVHNLSIESITDFVAETLQLDRRRVIELSEAIYSLTLGNIFFCRQAIDELTRKNAIYYDVMTFQWEFNISGAELNALLSTDVLVMIQSKLDALSPFIKQVLAVAAHIRATIEDKLLFECLQAYGTDLQLEEMQRVLDVAAEDGLLLKTGCNQYYKFSHDKVLEAAYTSISRDDRQKLKAVIAGVLFKRIQAMKIENDPDDEWMMFVAAEYFRSVPKELICQDAICMARLFFWVAKLSAGRGSYEKASRYLYSGIGFLRTVDRMWETQRAICLDVFNELIVIEFARGDMLGTKRAIDEVIWNENSPKDSVTAYYTKVEWVVKGNCRNYSMGVDESIKLLETMGETIPKHPTKYEALVEKLRMKMALKGRKVSSVVHLPIASDASIIKMLKQLANSSSLSQNPVLTAFCTMRAIRLSTEIGLSTDLAEILMCFTIPLRISGRFNEAYSYAAIVNSIYQRVPEERGFEYARAQMVLNCGVLPLKNRFDYEIDPLYSCYLLGLSTGVVDTALTSACMLSLHYHASGLPLNTVFEAKLILFQEKSSVYHEPSFTAVFKCLRQFQYNLVHTVDHPTKLTGIIMDEKEILADLDGNSKSMTVRDFSIFRLFLSLIYDDENEMERMLARLETYPLFDLPISRMHLRHLVDGLASIILGQRKQRKDYLQRGKKMMDIFQKLDRIGSENARPVYKCFKALFRQGQYVYDDAILSCEASNLLHLEALMNEHCGRMLKEKGSTELAKQYTCKAFLRYYDWGAFAKAESMIDKNEYLKLVPRTGRMGKVPLQVFLQQQRTSVLDSTRDSTRSIMDDRQGFNENRTISSHFELKLE